MSPLEVIAIFVIAEAVVSGAAVAFLYWLLK